MAPSDRTVASTVSRSRPGPQWRSARLETGYLLAEVTRLLRSAFDQRMRTIGVTGASWRVLVYLWTENGLTQASLARRLEVTRMALGQMIDRLVKSGHIERRPDAQDRRKWRLHLTAKSRAALPAILGAGKALADESFSVLSNAETRALRQTLMRLRERLRAMKIGGEMDDE